MMDEEKSETEPKVTIPLYSPEKIAILFGVAVADAIAAYHPEQADLEEQGTPTISIFSTALESSSNLPEFLRKNPGNVLEKLLQTLQTHTGYMDSSPKTWYSIKYWRLLLDSIKAQASSQEERTIGSLQKNLDYFTNLVSDIARSLWRSNLLYISEVEAICEIIGLLLEIDFDELLFKIPKDKNVEWEEWEAWQHALYVARGLHSSLPKFLQGLVEIKKKAEAGKENRESRQERIETTYESSLRRRRLKTRESRPRSLEEMSSSDWTTTFRTALEKRDLTMIKGVLSYILHPSRIHSKTYTHLLVLSAILTARKQTECSKLAREFCITELTNLNVTDHADFSTEQKGSILSMLGHRFRTHSSR